MPGSTITLCTEPDEFEAALRHAGHVELLVTRRGQYRSRLVRVALPRVSLLTAEESLPRIAFVSVPSGSLVIVLPLDREPRQIWAGLSPRPDTLITLAGGLPVHARTTGACRSGIICLPNRDLARHASALIGPDFVVPAGVQRRQPPPSVLRSLIDLHNSAIQVTMANPAAPADAGAARGLEEELLAAVVDCLAARPPETERAAAARHRVIMVRLEAILRAHPNDLPPLTEVCAALGVSSRTLRTCCSEHLGIGPRRYFRLRQLQRIHRALRHADPARTSISGLALRYGVKELGRFAGNYRELFGELPSATIRRTVVHPHLGEGRAPR